MDWLCIESEAVENETGRELVIVNVLPQFGREHSLNGDCWCHAEEVDKGGVIIITHNVFH